MNHTVLPSLLMKGLGACLLFMLLSCDKDCVSPDKYDEFIFGVYHCECAGQCATVYQISNNALRQGEGESCAANAYLFVTAPLPDTKLQIAKQLLTDFPDKLIDKSEGTYGCPDCADQGGYYLKLVSGNTSREWRIDTREDDLPEYLLSFQDLIGQVLLDLQ